MRQRHAVTHREYARQRRTHARVDQHRPVRQASRSSLGHQAGGRADSGGDDQQVGVKGGAVHHRGQPAIAAEHGLEPGTEPQPDMAGELGRDQVGDRFVHGAEHPWQRLDDFHVGAGADQRLRRLQADVPGAHHDGPADGAAVKKPPQPDRLVQGPDGEDPVMSEPWDGRAHRIGPAGDDQRVIAEVLAADAHLAGGRVDPGDPGEQPQVDTAPVAELLRRVGEQAFRAPHRAAEEVGDAAHAIGREPARLADHHVEAGRDAPGGRRGRHSRGAAADHDQPCHLPLRLPLLSGVRSYNEHAARAGSRGRSRQDEQASQSRPVIPVESAGEPATLAV